MTGTTHRPLVEPFSTGASWLRRALIVSAMLHGIVVIVWWATMHTTKEKEVELVDIEMAPPPPKAEALPAEVAKPPEQMAAAAQTPPGGELPAAPDEDSDLAIDAGVPDAPVDAPPKKKKKRPDAAVDEMNVAALEDGGVGDGGEGDARGSQVASLDDAGGGVVAMTDQQAAAMLHEGSGVGSAPAGPGSGVPAATEVGSGSGVPGMDNLAALDGPPTTAGTAANLLAYFPAGHQVTALIRFDRLRGTEWAEPAEKLFKPMPDYRALFGAREAGIGDKVETLVISTPRPRDAAATTLVVHSALSRSQLRDFLTNTDTPIAWSSTKAGLLGRRSGKLFQGDRRILLSPWKNWIVLAPPEDFGNVVTPAPGNLDAVELRPTVKLPAWLAGVRTIETESGDEKRGPALVLTLTGPGKRYKIPDVGLGITSAPSPLRVSLAMELVKQGWLVRGNILFNNEADAAEFETTAKAVQERITDSRVLSGLLRRQHALNMVTGLSVLRSGARVSYATSLSIADARALLAVMAATLDEYFQGQAQP